MKRRTVGRFVLAAGLALSCGAGVRAADSPLDRLLEKAAAYEIQFVEHFANVVAEEVYVQETTEPHRKRTLRSDLLFVQYPGASGWYVFRDVFEVDGKSVRDASKAERLLKLFTEAPRDAVARAGEIAREGARFNIWNIGTLNNPLIALAFLQPNYQSHFHFILSGIEKKLGPTIRTVRFEEFRQPTLLKVGGNGDLPSKGLLWIDETTGRVVKTRLQVGQARLPPEIVTTYRFDEGLGIDVPVEMRDWYPVGTGEVRGVATYGRFRRFQVKTDSEVSTPQ